MEKHVEILSPFKAASPSLTKQGYSVIPLSYGQKIPSLKNWSIYCKQLPERDNLIQWYDQSVRDNVGVTLGKASGIVALDFDNDVDGIHDKVRALLGEVVIAKRAEKGFTAFFRYNNEPPKKWQREGEMVLELLSDGNQTVVPPSLHPNGKVYEYLTEKTLENTPASELPYLRADFIDKVNRLFKIPNQENNKATDDNVCPEELETALTFIDSDNYYTWLQVGMALKEALGDEGYQLWYDWSAKSDKFNDKDMEPKWESFKKSGVKAGTIFKLALDNGYTFGEKAPQEQDVIETSESSILNTLKNWRKNGKPTGVPSGIQEMDNLLKWRKAEFTVVTGYPGCGKSEFIDFLMYNHIINNSSKCLFASFEGSSVEAHVDSFLHRLSGKTFDERNDKEDEANFNKIKDNLFFYNSEDFSHDITDILKYAEKIKDLDYLIIDPFNYVTSKYTDQVYYHVKFTCKNIKQFCKKNKTSLILIAHPHTKRDRTKNGRPVRCSIWDIAGGFDFWNMCDNGIVVHRDLDLNSDIDVDIQKVKIQDIDRTGSFSMRFDKESRLYKPLNLLENF